MWRIVSLNNAVWYVDATSNIHSKIRGQKRSFLYTIAAHDALNKTIVNVADFINTSHTSGNLTKYFADILNVFEKSKVIIAPVIVIDFSWALLISLMKSTNNCEPLHYLHWTYDMLINKRRDIYLNQHHMRTRIVLCSVHFFKNVVKKTKLILKSSKNEKRLELQRIFLFSFTLLLNSASVEEFENHLSNICYVFSSVKMNQAVLYSLKSLQDDVKSKKLNSTDISDSETADEIELRMDRLDREELGKMQENVLRDTSKIYQAYTKESFVKASPFTPYFEDFCKKLEFSIAVFEPHCSENPYYFPDLLEIITSQLYVMPLWTSCMVYHAKEMFPERLSCIKTMLSNNVSESNIFHLKNHILQGNKKLVTSELTTLMYNNIKSKYFRYYEKSGAPRIVQDINGKNLLKEIEETWKPEKKKRIKGYYFRNTKNFDLYKGPFQTELEILNNKEYDLAFDIPKIGQQDFKNSFIKYEGLFIHMADLIRSIYSSLKHNSNLSEIKKSFEENRSIIEKYIECIRKITHYTIYTNQVVDGKFDSVINENSYLKENNFLIVNTTADGNCFYSTLSIILFGNEINNEILKCCCFFIICENFEYFESLIACVKYTETLDQMIESLFKEKSWANEVIIWSSSLLLNRPIISFSIKPSNQAFDLTRFSDIKPIMIAFLKNHFSPILEKKHVLLRPPYNNLNEDLRKLFYH